MNFWNKIIGSALHSNTVGLIFKKWPDFHKDAHLVLLDGSGLVDGEHVEGGDVGRQEG